MRNLFLSVHNDDETLFGAFSLIREKPLVIIITDSYIQPQRGDKGCSAEERHTETIRAMEVLKCPVVFLGIKDTELIEDNLRERIQYFGEFKKVYIPAIQGGNPQHDIVGKVGREKYPNAVSYTTYTRTELYTTGKIEIIPTPEEIDLKEKALWCYQSQINLPATRPHFLAVINKSEWLI